MSFDETYDHWVFEGGVEPLNDSYEIRKVVVSLVRMGEERATNDRLPVKSISTDTPNVSVLTKEYNGIDSGQLEPAPGTKSISFEGFSEEDPRRVETRLKVSVEIAKGSEN